MELERVMAGRNSIGNKNGVETSFKGSCSNGIWSGERWTRL